MAVKIQRNRIRFLLFPRLWQIPPQKGFEKIPIAVAEAVIIPIDAPENPMYAKYCPIKGNNDPKAAKEHTYNPVK